MEQRINQEGSYTKEISREFFRNVYGYMFGALAITGITAYYFGNETFYYEYLSTETGSPSAILWLLILSTFGIAILIQRAFEKLSFGLLTFFYVLYSALLGIALSSIFISYSLPTIYSTFFVTAGAFAGMAILGYTTKTDLSKMGSILYMLFIGILISSFVNFFLMKSEMLDYIISIIGVFVFTGLTAYYMQELKEVAKNESLDTISRQKLSLIGGFKLYITFINLFLSLLRLVGSRD